jgi:hypothetical protein
MAEPTAGSMRGTLMVCGTDAEFRLQMPDVLEHGEHFELPVVKPEQHADADVVNARLHGAVKRR